MNKKIFFSSLTNLIKGGGILFIGTMIVNVGNYLFNLMVGRKLGPDNYGIFVTLNSFVAISGVVVGTFLTTSMKFTSIFNANKQFDKINILLRYLNKRGLIIGLFVSLIIFIFSGFISQFLNLDNKWLVVIISLCFIAAFPLYANRGIMQGLQNFMALSLNMILEPISKIILALIFIYLGYSINGVIGAIFVTSLIVYLISFIPLKKWLTNKKGEIEKSQLWHYSGSTLIAFVFLSIFTYADVLIVKHYFNSYDAGIYSAISVISKIVLYVSTPLIAAMFPKISDLFAKDKKHYLIFIQSFLLVVILSCLVLGVFTLFPTFSIKILFGQQYVEAANYLGPLSFAMFLLSLDYLLVNYFLSIGKNKFIWIMLASTILGLILVIFNHGSFTQIINSFIATYGFLFFGLSLIYIVSKKEQIFHAISNNSRLQ